MNNDLRTKIEETVKETMQSGFDVAMGGSPYLSWKENEKLQEKAYDKAVKKQTDQILDLFSQHDMELVEKINKLDGLTVGNVQRWMGKYELLTSESAKLVHIKHLLLETIQQVISLITEK